MAQFHLKIPYFFQIPATGPNGPIFFEYNKKRIVKIGQEMASSKILPFFKKIDHCVPISNLNRIFSYMA